MSDREYMHAEGRPSGFWATYPATKAILIGLPAIHLLIAMIGATSREAADTITNLLTLRPADAIGRLHVWQLVTYALVHSPGIGHLLWNCVGIFFFGRLVELRLGTRRYLYFALACVVAAGLGFLMLSVIQNTRTGMIGASGFDFGVLVLCALWYPNMTILLMFLFQVPLWLLATIFGFAEVYMLFQAADGIAHAAHVAGGLYALLYYRYEGRIEGIYSVLDRWRARRSMRRQQTQQRAAEELRGKVDRILDKVNREGMAALTDEERRALKDASARLRR